MEARQLNYFLVASQHQNHSVAARELGISASTLSTRLRLLEEELGVRLFKRIGTGFHPTREARWFYPEAQDILQTLQSAETYLRASFSADGRALAGSAEPLHILVSSSLHFFIGRASKALALAMRAAQAQYPEACFSLSFFPSPFLSDRLRRPERLPPAEHQLHLEYASADVPLGANDVALVEDEWVLVTNALGPIHDAEITSAKKFSGYSVVTGEPLSIAALNDIKPVLPRLPTNVAEMITAHLVRDGLSPPDHVEGDIGALPRLFDENAKLSLLVPSSSLSTRFDQRKTRAYPLDPPFNTRIVARDVPDLPPVALLLHRARQYLRQPEQNLKLDPATSFRQVQYFLKAFDLKSVTAAAAELNVAQPAISGQIRKLEQTLGLQLFERHYYGLEPTPAAIAFQPFAQRILARLSSIQQEAVAVGAPRAMRLRIGIEQGMTDGSPLVQALAAALPEWTAEAGQTDLQIMEAPQDILQEWLNGGVIGLVLTTAATGPAARLVLGEEEPLGVAFAPEMALSRALANLPPDARLDAAQLEGMPLALPTAVFGIRRVLEAAVEPAQRAGLRIKEINAVAVLLSLVRAGQCATILPQGVALAAGLEWRSLALPGAVIRPVALFNPDRELGLQERRLLALVRDRLALE